MPFSDGEHKKLTRQWYWDLQPETVVDVGAGAGTYADKFRPVHKSHWTAVEIFVPNIERFDLNNKYDKVIVSDVMYIDEAWLKSDLIIAGDVIEHIPYDDVDAVIEKLLRNCKYLLVSLPIIHFEQGTVEGNPFETHHYHWGYDEMLELLNRHGTVEKSENGDILGVYLVRGEL